MKRAIVIAALLAFAARAQDAGAWWGALAGEETRLDVTDGLVRWWKMDDALATNVVDSISGVNLSFVGGTNWVAGKIGNCARFNGSSYMLGAGYAFTSNIAVSLWFKADSLATSPLLFDTNLLGGNGSRPNSFALVARSDGLVAVYHNIGWKLVATNTVSTAQWHHVVLIRGNGVWTMWIDGVLQTATWTDGYSDYGYNTMLGKYTDTGAGFLTGYIDDVRVYGRSLSGNEVLTVYNRYK